MRFQNPDVDRIFKAYPKKVREKLLVLRQIIFATAKKTAGVGEIEEALKWGQPSYLTPITKSGSKIRIDMVRSNMANYAMYFHCQTSLVDSFRLIFGASFRYEGNRAILFDLEDEIPETALGECVAMALTYHLKK